VCTAPVRRGRFAAAGALIETAGGVAASATADLSDDGAVAQAITKLRHELGPVDLLVNNAGIVDPVGPTWEIEPDRWWRTMEVNLRGTLLCTQLVLPEMVHRRRGRIVNISSHAGVFRWPLVSAYSVSKARSRSSPRTSLVRRTVTASACSASIRVCFDRQLPPRQLVPTGCEADEELDGVGRVGLAAERHGRHRRPACAGPETIKSA
jgi:NADP-dependent 3-hydroxy acid dehydrogenase YdfG